MTSVPLPDSLSPETTGLSPRQVGLILFALTLGGFAIGTGEFASMGLMPNMVASLGVTEPQVGHLISAYALGVVVGAPLLAILGAGWKRKTLLLSLMGFYALGNLASALGPSYGSLLLFRFIAGLPHGAYFGVAALTAVAISPPERRGRAVSLVMLGLTLAILVGNPLATWAGQVIDWRWIYAAVAVVAVTTVVLLAVWLPAHVDGAKTKPLDELRAFNRLPVWQALGIGAWFRRHVRGLQLPGANHAGSDRRLGRMDSTGAGGLWPGWRDRQLRRWLVVRPLQIAWCVGGAGVGHRGTVAVSVDGAKPADDPAGHGGHRPDGRAGSHPAIASEGRGR